MNDSVNRCFWVTDDEQYISYHDQEWGVPERGDAKLFEALTLEGAQAGLSWITVLKKREGYRKAFKDFDISVCANMNDSYLAALKEDDSIIRHWQKIQSVRTNAMVIMKLIDEYGSLEAFILKTVRKSARDIDKASKQLSVRMKSVGMTFVGPTICQSFLEATGFFNRHDQSCHRYAKVDLMIRSRYE